MDSFLDLYLALGEIIGFGRVAEIAVLACTYSM